VRLPGPLRNLAETAAGVPALRHAIHTTQHQLAVAEGNGELLAESISDLERQLSDPGWTLLLAHAELEFSAPGLVQVRAICRVYALKNPLIKRGLALRAAYVWGQGVQIAARATGRRLEPGEQDVNAVVQDFLGDDSNQRAFTGASARERLERCLGTDGELFVALFTRPRSGTVQVRVVLADEISTIVTNPEDRSEPWYYRRVWQQVSYDTHGRQVVTAMERLYPCVDYRPASRPRAFDGVPVAWDSPMLHIRVNDLEGWQRGVPDAYAAIDWARAYKEFLEDWARLMRSLSRYTWRVTAPGNKAAAIRTRLTTAPTTDAATGAPNSAGGTAIIPPDVALEAISKSGATIDAGSGRPLAMMVAAALDVPVTMLLSDPGQTGARATAETLDQPTELAMAQRRELWAAAYQRILRHVITEAVRAPQGTLRGSLRRDPDTGREYLALAGDTEPTIDVSWPDLDDVDPAVVVDAIVKASATGVIPPEHIARLLLIALGVRDVDEIVDELLDDDGVFQWPSAAPLGGAGQAAADALANGEDPAMVDGGPMADDDKEEEEEPEPAGAKTTAA
jgi:hypothetical protein